MVLSEKGWVRALKGHVADLSELKFKDGDHAQHIVQCETTDKLLLFASDGRAFTLDAHKLPGGRGHGEPMRLLIELGDIDEVVALFMYEEGAKRVVASHEGYGFVVPEGEMLASKRSGKQILNGRAMQAAKVIGDQVAVIGERKKLLIFPLSELPEMTRGKGVKLQSYHDRGLADVKVFDKRRGPHLGRQRRARARGAGMEGVPRQARRRGQDRAQGLFALRAVQRRDRVICSLGGRCGVCRVFPL